uniref:Uncharacterized protein n=1 Tax=Ananas comosus var. bracteatus TaxID=296719 RepID=A0A6V7PXA4_ANACO|nr:unnamed protein product [Ananas comosus var. bracteatus]
MARRRRRWRRCSEDAHRSLDERPLLLPSDHVLDFSQKRKPKQKQKQKRGEGDASSLTATIVSLDLAAELGDTELLEPGDGVGGVWIGVGVGVGEAAAEVAEAGAAAVWGEEVGEGAPCLDLHGDVVPALRAVAANGASEEELLPRPPDLLVLLVPFLTLIPFLFFFFFCSSVVTASVHQPSRRVLVLVDRLLILSRGRAAYCGDLRRLADFLVAFGRPVPVGESPAEFALDAARSSSPARRHRSSSSSPPPLRDVIAARISQGKLVSSRGR